MKSKGKKKSLVDEYIRAQNLRDITSALISLLCDHEWIKEGLGFKCLNCDYYTGTNNELNDRIKKELL